MLSKLKFIVRRVISLIQRMLFFWACNGPLNGFAVHVLRIKNWQPLQLAKLDERIIDNSVTLAESSRYLIEAPRWIGESSLTYEGSHPKIRAHVLREAVTTAYSPGILKGGKLYLPGHLLVNWPRVMTDSAGLFAGGGGGSEIFGWANQPSVEDQRGDSDRWCGSL